jgi:hypothetical protein
MAHGTGIRMPHRFSVLTVESAPEAVVTSEGKLEIENLEHFFELATKT